MQEEGMREVGVHSEVGKLRTVMVCRPSLAHQRLTPGNCHDLLFDDVIWVHEAQKDHFDFVLKMQQRGVEVLELHDLLAETLRQSDGRSFILDRLITPKALVSLNGAFLPFQGAAGHLFMPLAKLLVLNPLAPRVFSWTADSQAVERLIRNTGSAPDKAAIDLYGRLIRCPGHVSAALGMMANWDLHPLVRDLRRLEPRLVLVAGAADRAIPSEQAARVRQLVPSATVEILPGLGHLAHEERPDLIANLIERLTAADAP